MAALRDPIEINTGGRVGLHLFQREIQIVSTVATAFSPIQQSLSALRAGQESFARFAIDLFADLEAMQRRLMDVQSQLFAEREHLAEERRRNSEEKENSAEIVAEPVVNPIDTALQEKVLELEKDRAALEEELESVRTRAVGMAQSLAEQKKLMAEEHAEWTAELRQLRRILDKQASWISQHTEMGAPAFGVADSYAQPTNGNGYANGAAAANGRAHPTHFPAAASGAAPRQADPVVGSILSQFELLQKDVARRREQAGKSG